MVKILQLLSQNMVKNFSDHCISYLLKVSILQVYPQNLFANVLEICFIACHKSLPNDTFSSYKWIHEMDRLSLLLALHNFCFLNVTHWKILYNENCSFLPLTFVDCFIPRPKILEFQQKAFLF